jgi:hypothetical protein
VHQSTVAPGGGGGTTCGGSEKKLAPGVRWRRGVNDISPPPSHGTRVRCTFFPRNKLDPGVGGVGWGGEVGWQTRSGGWLPQGKGKEDNDLPVPHTNLGEKSPLPPSPPTTGALFKRSPFSPCQVIRAPDLFTSSSSPSPLRVSMVRVGGGVGTLSFFFLFRPLVP